jgi:RNA polymerase sigma factor (sigma-70 family)
VPGDLDFVPVYQVQLAPVWRYVRSRIPDRNEAEDVTSEVFARAWRSWGSFDAERGKVAPWLLRIAQRTVVDWNRRHQGPRTRATVDEDLIDQAAPDPSELPESVLLAKEVLIEVNQASMSIRIESGTGLPPGLLDWSRVTAR